MTKPARPSLISDLMLQQQPPPESLTPEVQPPPQPARRVRPDIIHTSVYLPRTAHRKLREIAFHTDRKVHDLIIGAIDSVLREHGHPTTAELRAKAAVVL